MSGLTKTKNWTTTLALFEKADNRTITLLFAASDRLHNQAVVLQDFLDNCISISKT